MNYDPGDPPDVWPDDCPTCHAPNCDEEGDHLCAEAPGYCSVACREADTVRAEAEAAAEFAQLEEERRLAEEMAAEAALEAQLLQDRFVYGNSFEMRTADGKRVRLDPTKIVYRSEIV